MSSDDISYGKADLSRALSTLNIGSNINNESNNEEKEAITNINSVMRGMWEGRRG